MTNCIFDIELV